MIHETELFAMPLSSAQERLWILDRMSPGDPTLNLPASVRLSGRLDRLALGRAIAAIVARHEVLRTTFERIDERPLQVIHQELAPALSTVDLAVLPAAQREGEAAWIAGEESRRPFDLAAGPLLRATLVRLGAGEHTLLLTLHHIVADGWSIGILVRELSALYAEIVTGRPADLPELPIQYADFAHWQREQASDGAVDSQLAYWRGKLAGCSSGEILPPHRAAAMDGGNSASLTQTLPGPLGEELRALTRRERVTLFVTLLAAFKALLHRLSRRDDIVVGSPVAGRNRSEVKDLIGLFLNTLVLRTDTSGSPTFRELLARVRETVTEAMAAQDVPFEKLIEELRPDRARTPFFQVFFNMLSFPRGDLELPGLRVEYLAPAESGAKFDLTVYAEDGVGGLRLRWVYDAGRFERGRMEELLAQYALLLKQAAASPDARVAELSLVTERAAAVLPDPRAELGREWHGAVHEAFLAQAARRPDRLALSDAADGTVWTYGELAGESGRLAHHLISRGIAKGDLVAVYGHRNRYLVAAVLGILRSGAAFTILDPAYPPARHVECLGVAPPRAWVRVPGAGEPPPALVEFLAGCGLVCEVEMGPSGALPAAGAEPPAVEVGADDLACVAFTSGSTGRPKGVLGRHGPLSHFLPWQCARFDLREGDRYSLLSGLAHDPLQRDIFTPLWCGASVHIPDPALLAAPGWLAAWMRRSAITVSHLTPAMGRLICETAEPGLQIPSLRRAFFVGEALTWREERQLRLLAPAVTCVNLYGSTETQRAVACYEIPARPEDGGEAGERWVLPLGRGMQDAQLLLLTPAGGLAGIGEAGEIHVRSPHLARGYAGDPALTAERFLINPLTGEAGDRAYRTGDLGRYLPDGNVEFLGRVDDQVQIRGFRVEPAEVQTALGLHPAVRRALVLAVGPADDPDSPVGRRLIAYVVADSVRPPEIGELRQFLARSVPDYMVPAAFVFLAELPLQPNGKVDRRALPVPAPPAPAGASAPPRTQVEEIVAAAWSELLGAPRVGTDDDFFELGGHSLLVTRLVARLEKAFGVAVPLRLVFEASRLGEQAVRLGEMLAGGGTGVVPPIVPVPRGGDLPLSYAQQRLWFLDRLDPGNPVYNVSAAVRLAGCLQVAVLRRSLEEIVRRHEILRVRFREVRGEPVQTFTPPSPLALPVVDLAALPEACRAAEARRLVEAEVRTPFDLARGDLFRARLLRLAAQEHWVLVSLHHIVSDGWSMVVLVREFLDLYRAFAAGLPSPLPELRIQYGDYAAWQQAWLRGEMLERQLAYWRRQLAGAPTVLDLPTDLPRFAWPGSRGAYEPLDCPPELHTEVSALCRREVVTLFMATLAAFAAVLWHHSGQEEMVLGANAANRGRAEVEGLIGFFVNMLPLRLDLSGNPSLRQFLARVREVTLEAYSHQDVAFNHMVQELRIRREPGRTPLVQAVVDFQTAPPDPPPVSGLAASSVGEGNELTQFDLTLVVTAGERGMRWSMKYHTGLFTAATVRRLLGHLRSCLTAMVEDPEMRLDTLRQHFGEAERRELATARERLNQMRSQRFRPTKPQSDQPRAKEA